MQSVAMTIENEEAKKTDGNIGAWRDKKDDTANFDKVDEKKVIKIRN